ncbi:orotidine-5'-phosphate decarboxylase [Candidatus Peregrinibacteria bacterium CG_4_9_14_0_8_um_filter_44_15]|nr:MAG: orotidine 5'-phosphate decarboxylase [Candidatus Peregrinibacteria bacterium CG2_30_44_17]PIX79821.1 MAG: orotidine-5'-phosphate decarboxylase [Candidatus Peregrinibacteria bacterium CG_4_10_14_3_um_filter_44_21]PJB88469.1 MAG: orotidine-5'-phosphate decarboxylase [Candidatus Peregrinibacteria bacterium CG_4_9_14_0_8_um_filter_44_15]
MNFADRLVAAIKKKGNPICVGLDPRLDQIPAHIVTKVISEKEHTKAAAAECFLEFNKGIIDAVCDIVPACKPQIAFYEQYGFAGYFAYEETCKYAQEKGLIVIADAKRNDIGSTAEGYSSAFLGEVDLFGVKVPGMAVDALTVNAYLGWDGIKPFVDACRYYDRGIFALVKTSNPSAGELQDQELSISGVSSDFAAGDRMTVYELMAHYIDSWGADLIGDSGYSSVGAVVGATYPDQARILRKMMPSSIFLVPGYGAQGGGAADVKPCFNEDSLGAIINSSRDIIFAYEKSDQFDSATYADAARVACFEMVQDLKSVGIGS